MKYAIGVLLALAVIGLLAWFYLNFKSPSVPTQPAAAGAAQQVEFKVLDQGITAINEPARKNYAIYTVAAFTAFWKEAHSADGKPMPIIDFSKNYVIGVFAGSVPTEGYAIAVSKITESDNTRAVSVTITEPGEKCPIVEEPSSPYQFVQVPFSDATAFTHADVHTRTSCP